MTEIKKLPGEIAISYQRLDDLDRLFVRSANQSNLALITLSYGAYLEAITNEIIGTILPSLKSANHIKKLRGLRDFPVIDDAGFQAATSFAHVRNVFAHSFEDCSLSHPDIAQKFQTFVGIMSKRFTVDNFEKAIEKKVEDYSAAHFGMAEARHAGFSGNDGERMKCAALFLCLHFLAVQYSLPPKGTPLALDPAYEIKAV